jgi:hypothetical protein
MGRRHGHAAMVGLADQFDGGIGSPSQQVMEEEVGSADAPDLVFRRSPVVGKARVEATRALMDPMAPHNRLVTYVKHDFADDVAWVRNGAPSVPSCEPSWTNGALTFSPERLGPQNLRIGAWTEERRDLFAVALFWAVLLDEGVYTWRREAHARWMASLPVPFPKLVGECPGGCGSHLDPYIGMKAVRTAEESGAMWQVVDRRNHLMMRSMRSMERYVTSLLEQGNVPDPAGVWQACQAHLPTDRLRLLRGSERPARQR